jgi:hypothetical protein
LSFANRVALCSDVAVAIKQHSVLIGIRYNDLYERNTVMQEQKFQTELTILPVEVGGYSGVGTTATGAANHAFEVLADLLSKSVAPLRDKLITTANGADEVELSLSLAMTMEGKWVVVSTTGSATLSAKLVWKKKG